MSKHAQLADGTILEFPDETPDDVMDRAVKQHIGGQPSTGQRGMGSGRQQTFTPQDNPPADYGLSSLLPTPRTLARTGGATLGGIVGSAGGPAGTIAGGAAGGGLGDALYQAVQAYRMAPDAPRTIGQSASGIGGGIFGGAAQEAVGAGLNKLAGTTASGLYRTALKPSNTLTNEEAANISNTLLKNRIPISDSGSRKLNSLIKDLNSRIDAQIATNPNSPVPSGPVAAKIDPVVSDLLYKDLQRDASAAAIEKARFIGEHSKQVQYSPFTPPVQYSPYKPAGRFGSVWSERFDPALTNTEVKTYTPPSANPYAREAIPPVETIRVPNDIPAARAQTMKKALYSEVYPVDSPSGYEKARMAEGVGLKEGLEALFPNIKGLNAQEGSLLEARPSLSRAVNRTENNDALGLGVPVMAGGVNALTGKPPLALAAALMKNAGSRTAINLDRLAGSQTPFSPASYPRVGLQPLLDALSRLSGKSPNR